MGISVYLIGAILIQSAGFYIYKLFIGKKIDRLEKENMGLADELNQKVKLITNMKAHAKRVNLTKKELEPIKKEVAEAKTDEEVINAIANIVSRNNRKL